jgi:hypothetical protein
MTYEGQQAQADAQSKAYEAQARAAEQNARIENRRMEQDADNYAQKSRELAQRQKIIEGQQRAQIGSAGLNMAGSGLDILAAGYDAYNQDKQTLLMNQRNDNFNRRVAEGNYLNQAAGDRSAAANVKSLAKVQGAATILGTAASIYGMDLGGGAKAKTGVPTSTTSQVGTNTTANWTMNKGYSFTPTNTPGNWSGLSLLPKNKTYFPY